MWIANLQDLEHISNISAYLNTDLSPLDLKDSKEDASEKFSKQRIEVLPVISQGFWCGNLKREELEIQWDNFNTVEELEYLFDKDHLKESDGWNRVFSTMIKAGSAILTLVDKRGKYLGFYDTLEILQLMESLPFVNQEHRELTISHNLESFSFSQISRTIEDHGGEILQYTLLSKNSINCSAQIFYTSQEVSDTLDVLHAFGYHIISSDIDEDRMNELMDRSEYLKKFLSL